MAKRWLRLPGGKRLDFGERARRVLPGLLVGAMHILPLRGDMYAFDA